LKRVRSCVEIAPGCYGVFRKIGRGIAESAAAKTTSKGRPEGWPNRKRWKFHRRFCGLLRYRRGLRRSRRHVAESSSRNSESHYEYYSACGTELEERLV